MGILELAIFAFVISIVAGALGFTGIAKGAGTIAKIAFGVFLVIAIVLFILFILGMKLIFQLIQVCPDNIQLCADILSTEIIPSWPLIGKLGAIVAISTELD